MKPQFIDVSLAGTKTIQVKTVDQYHLDTPFHFHHLCELVWIEKSHGKRIVGDHVDNFEDNDLVLMGPNLPHIWQNDDIYFEQNDEKKVKATVIYFLPDFLLNLSDEQVIVHPIQELIERAYRGVVFYGQSKEMMIEKISTIHNEKNLKKITAFLELIHLLCLSKEYYYLASVSYKNLHDEKDADRIHKVYQYLMQHFRRDISLQEVSDICYMTPNAFCRYFKSRTQKSFTQFLNELRIGHAAKLLQNENYSIADICYECGYNNLTNFNKFFKSIRNITPSAYRKTLKNSI